MAGRKLQIHLSTALIVSVLAAILLGANFYERTETRSSTWPGEYEVHVQGFPMALSERPVLAHWPESVSFRPEGLSFVHLHKNAGWVQYAVNTLFALLVLIVVGSASEWHLRRPRNSAPTSSDSP